MQAATKRAPILFAISDQDMRSILNQALEKYDSPYPYIFVAGITEAVSVLREQTVRCLVMTLDMALAGADGMSGLIKLFPKLPPTVTLLNRGDGFPNYLYETHSFHDWCTFPFSLDELYERVARVVSRAESRDISKGVQALP